MATRGGVPLRVLFVCSRNRLRSPTAERLFSARADLEVASAGTASDADEPLTADALQWADVIFVMEARHRRILNQRFKTQLGHARIVCLGIPDHYGFMDPALVMLLTTRIEPHLTLRRNDWARRHAGH